MWGGLISVLGAALPFITVELARMPPSPVTRWLGFLVAVAGGVMVARGRSGEPAPVRGLFSAKGK